MTFFKRVEQRPHGMQYGVWMMVAGLPPAFNGETPVALFGNEEECDKYLKEWTLLEAGTLIHLTAELWSTTDLKQKMKVSAKIERLKNTVQKRAGIVDT